MSGYSFLVTRSLQRGAAALLGVALVPAAYAQLPTSAGDQPAAPPDPSLLWAALAAIALLMFALMAYVWVLRERTTATLLPAAGDGDPVMRQAVLAAYAQLPLGVPRGSVRAIMALLIVFGSLVFLALSMIKPEAYTFPAALTGILGAILGFYFGKGSNESQDGPAAAVARADANQARQQAQDATQQATGAVQQAQDAAQRAQDATQQAQDAQERATRAGEQVSTLQDRNAALSGDRYTQIRSEVQGALEVGRVVAGALPGSLAQQVGVGVGVLEGALKTIDELRGGDVTSAATQAAQIAASALPNNPLARVLAGAASALAPITGAVPPLALVTAIVGISARLISAAHARWVARVMDEPYAAEQFSPEVFDSNAAMSLLEQAGALRQAFDAEVRAGDRTTVLDVVRLAFSEDGGAGLRAKYGAKLSGVDAQALEEAMAALHRAALDLELLQDLPPDAAKDVGGLPAVLQVLDRVRTNPAARAGLDAAMTAAAAMRKAGKQPEEEFKRAAAALSAQASEPTSAAVVGAAR